MGKVRTVFRATDKLRKSKIVGRGTKVRTGLGVFNTKVKAVLL